jgi:hypothetical protein
MITFNEALNNYYEFKTLYENSYNKEKRDIINNKKLSWNEKRSKFQKLKPKCINCKRPVGTLFSRKFTSDNSREFKTLSGDKLEQIKYNTTAHDIIYKYITSGQLSKEDSKILQTVVKDTLKMVGLGAIAIPIPGGSLLVAILITGAKKFNINLLPSKFNNDIKK